ncbi:MAG: hypothetical protein HYX92_08120 [Chloroflexi bacterium]|nr:hypothetical protein [Chloroflexota bacterium]
MQRWGALSQHSLRYVAHLDMLGMSELTARDPDIAWELLSKLCDAKEERLSLQIMLTEGGEIIRDRVRSYMFSDTIIVFSVADDPPDTYAMILLVTELFSKALSYCVPLRGGIAHGQFKFDLGRNLFAGPALLSAYRLGEASQWLGIRVDKAVANRALAIPILSGRGNEAVIPWEVPVKRGGTETSYVVDWVETHRKNFPVSAPINLDTFYYPFKKTFGSLDQLHRGVREKYENTVAFINQRLSR